MQDPSSPRTHQQSVSAQQLAIYGESWADRFGRLLTGLALSQSRLAAVIGLSAPMMSQLITGQRVKISNPAVYGRIVRLEELLSNPAVQLGDREQVVRLLAEVAASQPSLTTTNGATTVETKATPAGHAALLDRAQVVLWLSANTTSAGRAAAAEAAARAGDLELAEVLRVAGS